MDPQLHTAMLEFHMLTARQTIGRRSQSIGRLVNCTCEQANRSKSYCIDMPCADYLVT